MKQTFLVCLIVLSKLFTADFAINTTTYVLYKNHDNWHRFNGQFMNLSGVTRVQCSGYCNQRADCLSFNYNSNLKICELNDYYPLESSANYVSEAGWKTYYIQSVDPKVGAIAWQSSTIAWGTADLALDGNTAGRFFQRSCTHTEKGDAWWVMEMMIEVQVKTIVIYLRADSCDECSSRNQNLQFLVSTTKDDVENNIGLFCETYVGPPVDPSVPVTISCGAGTIGKYLKVIQGNNLPLSICEIFLNVD